MSRPHLPGRTARKALCGARIRDQLTEVTYPERDGVEGKVCPACAARIPRAGLSGRLFDLVTGTGRFQR